MYMWESSSVTREATWVLLLISHSPPSFSLLVTLQDKVVVVKVRTKPNIIFHKNWPKKRWNFFPFKFVKLLRFMSNCQANVAFWRIFEIAQNSTYKAYFVKYFLTIFMWQKLNFNDFDLLILNQEIEK